MVHNKTRAASKLKQLLFFAPNNSHLCDMLRIGFDAKRAFQNYTGLGNYSRSVIESLSACYPANQYFLYAPRATRNQRTEALFGASNLHIRQPRLPFLKSLWRSRLVVSDLQKDGIQLYHGLSNELPVGISKNIRTVVTIHDLIFLRYPQYYKAADRRIYEAKFRYACRHADAIVAISEQTKRDIVHYFGTLPERIRVIYQTCDPLFEQPVTSGQLQAVKSRYNLPDRYLLNVGTIEPRKNALLILKAMTRLPDTAPLVLIGKETDYAAVLRKFIAANGLEPKVIFLKDVAFTDLPAIYRQASVFIYPSEFEGFGIPVLEALKSGVPVIAATGSCLEEAGGTGSIYIDPADDAALAEAIRSIPGDEAIRNRMTQQGLAFAAGFSESIHAKNLVQLYQSLVS